MIVDFAELDLYQDEPAAMVGSDGITSSLVSWQTVHVLVLSPSVPMPGSLVTVPASQLCPFGGITESIF